MARNGSGTYTAPVNSWNAATNGNQATAADWQSTLNDLVAAMTQSVSADGQTVMTGNLAMGTKKLTGLGAGTATGDSLRFEQLFSQGVPATVASAATTDIGAQNSVAIEISGTTTITSMGTNYNGPRYTRFTGILTLTHNATAMNLPGAVNITVAVGDIAIWYPNIALNGWNLVGYQSAAGIASPGLIQKQTYIAFTTAGTATAFTLTPSPAITANTAGMEFEVTFNAAAGTTPTLAVSGLTALNLKYRDSTGALQAITSTQVPSGWVSKVYSDGTNWVVMNPAFASGSYKCTGLVGTNNAATPLTKFDLSADAVTLRNTSGETVTRYVTGTITNDFGLAGSAVNGRDQAAAFTASSWTHIYFVWNGTTLATISSPIAPSAFTAATLPTGYTHWAYATTQRWNGASNIVTSYVEGSKVYAGRISALTGGTAVAYTAVSVSTAVPPNALTMFGDLQITNATAGIGSYNLTIRAIAAGPTTGASTMAVSVAGVAARGLTQFTQPNIAQQLFYILDSALTTADINTLGYTVANGDS